MSEFDTVQPQTGVWGSLTRITSTSATGVDKVIGAVGGVAEFVYVGSTGGALLLKTGLDTLGSTLRINNTVAKAMEQSYKDAADNGSMEKRFAYDRKVEYEIPDSTTTATAVVVADDVVDGAEEPAVKQDGESSEPGDVA